MRSLAVVAVMLTLAPSSSAAGPERSARRAEARARRDALEATPVSGRERRARFRAWRRAARRAGASRARLRALSRAEGAVDAVARRPRRPVPAKLESSLALLEAQGMDHRARWGAALVAWVRARTGAPEQALLDTARLERFARTEAALQLAYAARAEAHLALGAPEAAVRAAAKSLSAGPDTRLVPDARLRRACAALREAAPERSCAEGVHAVTGAFLVSAADRGPAVAARDPRLLDRLHAEASVFLQDCLLQMARAAPERLRGARLELSWVIDDAGRARAPEIRPRRHAELLEGCLPERLGWLRYPKLSSGEHENVSLRFAVR